MTRAARRLARRGQIDTPGHAAKTHAAVAIAKPERMSVGSDFRSLMKRHQVVAALVAA
jgi:hypothetical protein